MPEDRKPLASKQLIDYLERTYPDRCPEPHLTEREVWIAYGCAKVIRKLRTDYNESQSEV
jgi:hypothetical protein